MIGRIVGTYEIVERLGEGGMGTVWRAVDRMLERDVALKAIRPDLAGEPQIVDRFRSEAKTIARVNHPAITTIYSFFNDGPELFIAMEYVRGESLADVLRRERVLPWRRAVALVAAVLEGVEQVHRLGIVHRDLKPDNLMITGAGTVKVMDFGIARVAGSGHLTRTGLLVGTLRYMSPEQIRGTEADRRTDVYALGTVLYEAVAGRVPFTGESDYALLKAQMETLPEPPSAHVPSLPAWLDQAILRALAKEPAERFQSAEEMRSFLLGAAAATAPELTAPTASPANVASTPGATALASQPTVAATRASPETRPTPQGAAQRDAPSVAGPPGATAGGGSYRVMGLGGSPVAPGVAGTSSGRNRRVLWGGLAAVFLVAVLAVALTLGRRDSLSTKESTAAAASPAAGSEPGGLAGGLAGPSAASLQAGAASVPPAPAPVVPAPKPTSRQPAHLPAEEPRHMATPPAASEPAAATGGAVAIVPPAMPEPAPATTVTEAPETSAPTLGPIAELSRLAGEAAAASNRLVEAFDHFRDAKEDGGAELTPADDLLRDEIATLAERSEVLAKRVRFPGGGFFGRARDRMHRPNPAARRAEVERRLGDLAQTSGRVDRLMAQVAPGSPVAPLWQEIQHRIRRMVEIGGIDPAP